jgi:hypothetical protein
MPAYNSHRVPLPPPSTTDWSQYNRCPSSERPKIVRDSSVEEENSWGSKVYNPQTNEGAAFEEQIGFHGGLGGPQTEPFLLFPKDLPLGDEPLIGAEAVYRVLKGWVGHE